MHYHFIPNKQINFKYEMFLTISLKLSNNKVDDYSIPETGFNFNFYDLKLRKFLKSFLNFMAKAENSNS